MPKGQHRIAKMSLDTLGLFLLNEGSVEMYSDKKTLVIRTHWNIVKRIFVLTFSAENTANISQSK